MSLDIPGIKFSAPAQPRPPPTKGRRPGPSPGNTTPKGGLLALGGVLSTLNQAERVLILDEVEHRRAAPLARAFQHGSGIDHPFSAHLDKVLHDPVGSEIGSEGFGEVRDKLRDGGTVERIVAEPLERVKGKRDVALAQLRAAPSARGLCPEAFDLRLDQGATGLVAEIRDGEVEVLESLLIVVCHLFHLGWWLVKRD
jgi:hypothetical protein